MKRRHLAGLVVIGCLVSGQAQAQSYVLPNISPVMERIFQSGRLLRYGREAGNPLALLLAAQMLRESGAEPFRLKGGDAPLREDAAFPSPLKLAEEAKTLAKGDENTLRLIDNFLATREKGRENGPLFEISQLEANGTDAFAAIRFAGRKRAEIYVEGQGELDLIVQDAQGQVICRETRNAPVVYCWWNQLRDGVVKVEIINRTGSANTYRLVTN